MTPEMAAAWEHARAVRGETMAAIERAASDELHYKPGQRWNVREVLIHLGNWEDRSAQDLCAALHGQTLPALANLDQWNAEQVERYAHLDLAGVLAYLENTSQDLAAAMAAVSPSELSAKPSLLALAEKPLYHEVSHLHQIRENLALARGDLAEAAIHHLAYARERVLIRLRLESTPPTALEWRPAPEKWSAKETLIHLASWDRYFVSKYAARAGGQPEPPYPFPEGGIDAWNEEQVRRSRFHCLAEVLHELGAARGALIEQIRRLSHEQLADEKFQAFLEYRDHDHEHMRTITARIRGWEQSHA